MYLRSLMKPNVLVAASNRFLSPVITAVLWFTTFLTIEYAGGFKSPANWAIIFYIGPSWNDAYNAIVPKCPKGPSSSFVSPDKNTAWIINIIKLINIKSVNIK